MPAIPHRRPAAPPAAARAARLTALTALITALTACGSPAPAHLTAVPPGPGPAKGAPTTPVPPPVPSPAPTGAIFRTNGAVSPCPAAAARPGSLYVAAGHMIRRISTRTGATTTLATTSMPGPVCALAADRAGNLFIAAGTQVQFLARANGILYGARPTAGHLYTIAGGPSAVRLRETGDGGPARQAGYGRITGLSLDPAGNILISGSGRRACQNCDDLGGLVRVIAERTGRFYAFRMKAGDSYSVAGNPTAVADSGRDHGPATANSLGDTVGQTATDPAGNLILLPQNPIGPIRVIAVRPGTFYGIPMLPMHISGLTGGGS